MLICWKLLNLCRFLVLYIEYELIIHTSAKSDNYDSLLGDACNQHSLTYALSLSGMLMFSLIDPYPNLWI